MPTSILLISFLFLGISLLVSGILKGKFNTYGKISVASGLTGAEVAAKMLRDNMIYDVKITSVNGFMTDHYNPANKTINLSPEVYSSTSVAAAAVAAHETGHAIQHADAYRWLTMRSKLVPVVQFSSGIVQWVLLLGVLMVNSFPQLLLAGVILFGMMTLFSIITLPVEIDASRRALAWLNSSRVVSSSEYPKAKDALKWAALTYVVAAFASIATLLQYIMILVGGSRRD
jgi:Zn-dependent membrane protease YugP